MFFDCRKGVRANVTLSEIEATQLKSECRSMRLFEHNRIIIHELPIDKKALVIHSNQHKLYLSYWNNVSVQCINNWHDVYRLITDSDLTIIITAAANYKLAAKYPLIYNYFRKLNEFKITTVCILSTAGK